LARNLSRRSGKNSRLRLQDEKKRKRKKKRKKKKVKKRLYYEVKTGMPMDTTEMETNAIQKEPEGTTAKKEL
jgi:actin-like ATPase involved in cell morphogenesis